MSWLFKIHFYFLDSVRTNINCQGVSFNEEIVDGVMAGSLFSPTIKGTLLETWFIADRIGHIESNYDVEINSS